MYTILYLFASIGLPWGFEGCMLGPDQLVYPEYLGEMSICQSLDLDSDHDVDLYDYSIWDRDCEKDCDVIRPIELVDGLCP